jgi:hypothetical protein
MGEHLCDKRCAETKRHHVVQERTPRAPTAAYVFDLLTQLPLFDSPSPFRPSYNRRLNGSHREAVVGRRRKPAIAEADARFADSRRVRMCWEGSEPRWAISARVLATSLTRPMPSGAANVGFGSNSLLPGRSGGWPLLARRQPSIPVNVHKLNGLSTADLALGTRLHNPIFVIAKGERRSLIAIKYEGA